MLLMMLMLMVLLIMLMLMMLMHCEHEGAFPWTTSRPCWDSMLFYAIARQVCLHA